jgi:hypothetical protein
MTPEGAVYCGRRPVSSTGRRDFSFIQSGRYFPWGLAGDIGVEYLADYGGFILIDPEFARRPRHGPVAVSPASCMPAVTDDARHAAPDLVG